MKKFISVFVLMSLAFPFMANAEVLPGDVDGNGKVEITDVTFLIDYLLTKDATSVDLEAADVDGDGQVCIADVTVLIDMILTASPNEDDHEWVDLGLPSGTLWATCNIGASSPEDYGDYFAWGETEPKEVYNWETYKWCNGTINTLTKYCKDSYYGYNGYVDTKTELDTEDDAASVNWGTSWQLPSVQQMTELRANCNRQWTTKNGISGFLFTSKKNSNTLFLPAAGKRSGSSLSTVGSDGYYWSRTQGDEVDSRYACRLHIYSNSVQVLMNVTRDCGFTVRAVRVP